MRITRAPLLSPLVPLLSVAAIAVAQGARSIGDIGEFVLLWATVLYPLVLALVLAALAINHRKGPCALWHFALGGFVVGTVLTGAWFEPWAVAAPLIANAALIACGGGGGAATAITVWYLGVYDERAERPCTGRASKTRA